MAQVERELGVVLQQAECFELPQRATHFLAGLPGQLHQLVGVDALIGTGVIQEAQYCAVLLVSARR